MMAAPFHEGELRAQALAGVVGSGNAIRDYMPDQHRAFFAELPFMLAATLDAQGRPRAQVLAGAPGFVTSPDARTLRIAGQLEAAPGQPIGLLGLQTHTRRRNRANGVVHANQGGVLEVNVLESFGNCPQHITVRTLAPVLRTAGPLQAFDGLEHADLVARADTFFVATSGGQYGVDISHRGGPPGFVGIDGATLTVPDYKGNRYFNTFGNLLIDAHAALLFIDFDSGDVLELQGRARIIWDAERRWEFQAERGWFQAGALALREV